MKNNIVPSVFFDMLRSFVTVAETLKINRSVESLGVSRQTIRHHLNDLERLTGETLFETKDRQYQITKAGEDYLGAAKHLIANANNWVEGNLGFTNLLESIAAPDNGDGFFYYSKQHPLTSVWKTGLPLIRSGIDCWVQSQGKIEHPEFQKIRPFLLIFRKNRNRWVCTFVGEESSFATWLGLVWAKSAVGSSLDDDDGASLDAQFTIRTYNLTAETGTPRFDHVYGAFAREEGGMMTPVSFQRLIFPCILPDGEPIISVLVARTNRVQIDALEGKEFSKLPKEELMEYEV